MFGFHNNTRIHPEKVTKPFQLLAAWLVGLILLEAELILASLQKCVYRWMNPMYGISAILIIPVFLRLIFLLQTKYRPEMQEDSYYSRYLFDNLNQTKTKGKKYTQVKK